ncbi:MAG: V-type ATP synthase subunit F [Treponema sp.]|nr:V-type ATP synthase subunit F [Treponema sp.]
MEYFVIGEREIVLGFNLVGVKGSIVATKSEALDAFSRLTGHGGTVSVPVDERPKILILTEEVSQMLEEEVLEWQKGAQYPLIVEIPGIHGHMEGKKSLTESIREAVGISV